MRRHLLKVWLTRCKAVKPASGAALRGAASFHFHVKRGFLAGNPRGGVSGEGERPRLRVTRSPHSTGKSHCSKAGYMLWDLIFRCTEPSIDTSFPAPPQS